MPASPLSMSRAPPVIEVLARAPPEASLSSSAVLSLLIVSRPVGCGTGAVRWRGDGGEMEGRLEGR